MSDRLASAAEALRGRMEGSGFQGTVRFDVEDEGVIRVEDERVETGDGPADCTIAGSLDTLQELFRGELDPTSAFMTGKIRIDGQMGLAMKLAQLL